MGQDRGLLDDAVPHCEGCAHPLEQQGDQDRWTCVNPACERRGEMLDIAS